MSIEDLKCPDCGGPMVSRKNHKTGQRFWGCADYPECTGTRNTESRTEEREAEFERKWDR